MSSSVRREMMLKEGARGGEVGEEGPTPPWRPLNATAIRDPGPEGAAFVGAHEWVVGRVLGG